MLNVGTDNQPGSIIALPLLFTPLHLFDDVGY